MEATGLHHLIFTIGEVERSKAFYGGLLGFAVEDMDPNEGLNGFYFPVGEVWLFFFTSDRTEAADRFSEFRIGLDHVAFTVPTREALDALAEKLIAAGVDTAGVELFKPSGNWYVAFRDPDNIQLEAWLPRERGS